MRSVLLTVLLTCLLLPAAQAGEKTYRWRDSLGRVHYSDVKSHKGEQVQIRPGSGIATAPKVSPAMLAERQQDCQRKRDQLAAYSSSAEITETDGLGKSRSYTAAERQQLIARIRVQVEEACGPLGATATVESDAPKS